MEEGDKRFIRDEGEEDQDNGQKKGIPIELPDIDYPIKSEAPEAPKEAKKPPEAPLEEKAPEEDAEAGAAEKSARPRRPIFLLLFTLILFLLLCTSAAAILYLMYNKSRLETKMASNANAIQIIVAEKEELAADKASLEEAIERLKESTASAGKASESTYRQIENLKKALAQYKEKNAQLEDATKEHADDLKNLVATNIGYYDAYKKEKADKKELESTVTGLEAKIENLTAELTSISGKQKSSEISHIYEMAFIYIKGGLFNEALRSFEKYMEAGGEDANVHYNIAYIYEHAKKDRAQAIKHYQKYLEMKPDAKDFYEVKARISSLKRSSRKDQEASKKKRIKINLDTLKY